MKKFHYGDPEVNLNLADFVENGARSWPDNPAIIYRGSGITYAQFDAAANRLANALAKSGVGPDDTVAIMLPNLPEFPIAYFAVLKLGAIVVPVNTMFKEMEIRYILEDSRARAIIAWQPAVSEVAKALSQPTECRRCLIVGEDVSGESAPRFASETQFSTLQEAIQTSSPRFTSSARRETDTAVILYTSGTTGRSKGAELTHFNMYRNAVTVADMIGICERDRFVATLPLFHSFGQTHVMNATFARGGAIIPHPRFDAANVLESFRRDGVTLFAGVPTMYVYLLNATEPAGVETSAAASPAGGREDDARPSVPNSLRLCISGGAPMPISVLHEFERRFGVVILEGYGLSETSPVACSNRPDRVRKPGSIGLPLKDVEMRVVDDDDRELGPGEVGEIVIMGPNIMKGYLNKPEATAEAMRNGWFHTGDLAYRDEDGYFYIVDRKKDMILKSGYNVYPREVEEVLYRHPAVAEAAVIGVPDPIKGEEVKAYVVLKDGFAATEEELIGHCRELVAPYKCPKYVELLPALPKSATGKILRRELRDLAGKMSVDGEPRFTI